MKVESKQHLGFGLGIFRFKLSSFHTLPPEEKGKLVGLLTGNPKADIFENSLAPELKIMGESTDDLRRIVVANPSNDVAGVEIKASPELENTVVNQAKGILNGGTLQAEVIPNLKDNFRKILVASTQFYNDMSYKLTN